MDLLTLVDFMFRRYWANRTILRHARATRILLRTMKLYEVPRHTRVRLRGDVRTPPGAVALRPGDIVLFDHIDGMYSYCHTAEGTLVHPAAWSDVEIVPES